MQFLATAPSHLCFSFCLSPDFPWLTPKALKSLVLCAVHPFEVCLCCLFFSSLQRGGYTQKHKPDVKTCPAISDRSAHSKEDCCHFRQRHWCQLNRNSPSICCVVSAEGQLLSSPFSMASHMLCVAFQLLPPKSVASIPHWKQSLVCCGWEL